MYNLTVCIVLYKNNREVLLKAIRSVLSSNINLKLYLSDNSPDDSLKDIIDDHRVEYIFNNANNGFGAGHNIVIKKIIEISKYHLVLNPDVYFDGEILARICDFMDQDEKIGNLMPKIFYPNGDLQYLCKLLPTPYDWIGRRFSPFKKSVAKRNELFELRFTKYNFTMEVPYLSGCFMFLRTDALKKIGLYDEKIFMYGEETDLCRRLIVSNYKTIFYPEVSIVHEFQKGSHKSWKLTWIGMKSAFYYFTKWGWFFDKDRKRINNDILNKIRKLSISNS